MSAHHPTPARASYHIWRQDPTGLQPAAQPGLSHPFLTKASHLQPEAAACAVARTQVVLSLFMAALILCHAQCGAVKEVSLLQPHYLPHMLPQIAQKLLQYTPALMEQYQYSIKISVDAAALKQWGASRGGGVLWVRGVKTAALLSATVFTHVLAQAENEFLHEGLKR